MHIEEGRELIERLERGPGEEFRIFATEGGIAIQLFRQAPGGEWVPGEERLASSGAPPPRVGGGPPRGRRAAGAGRPSRSGACALCQRERRGVRPDPRLLPDRVAVRAPELSAGAERPGRGDRKLHPGFLSPPIRRLYRADHVEAGPGDQEESKDPQGPGTVSDGKFESLLRAGLSKAARTIWGG